MDRAKSGRGAWAARAWAAGTLLAGLLGLGGGTALADEHPIVLELFTSQGCTACPPADRMASRLAHRDDLIVLSLHVDYWDYLGWPDAFAQPAFAARQRGYARAARHPSVFTPQFVVQGGRHVVGYRPDELMMHVAESRQEAEPVALSLVRVGEGRVRLELRPHGGPVGAAELHLVRYQAHGEVQIDRGENAGRLAKHANIVTEWRVLGPWDGASAMTMEVPAEGAQPVVVLVQGVSSGPIMAARRLR
ncbi:MAG: DUF1223 domain-containing protein [Rhodobacteraceae bacterium]|nr:DUF1223 domain-containing protein [Paracoccaceae bacterium]